MTSMERPLRRLSSMFTLNGSSQEPKVKLPQSRSTSKISLSPRDRSPVRQDARSPIPHSPSAQHLSPHLLPTNPSPSLLPILPELGPSTSLAPPTLYNDLPPLRPSSPIHSRPGSRAGSRPASRAGSRPGSPVRQLLPSGRTTPTTDVKSKRRSWMSSRSRAGSFNRSRAGSQDIERSDGLKIWIVGNEDKVEYDATRLERSEKIPELWDENGDTFVYLFPRTASKEPSFKIDSSVYSSSPALTLLARGETLTQSTRSSRERNRRSLEVNAQCITPGVPATPPMTPKQEPMETGSSKGSRTSGGSRNLSDILDEPRKDRHLYVPISLSANGLLDSPISTESGLSSDDTEILITVRNLFAFLYGQSLVATTKHPSIFSIFLGISNLLKSFEFSNQDGSTFGETAGTSFSQYVEEFCLADVRKSREKTVEGVILGERMRCQELYNEAFVHCVGRYDDIVKVDNPKFDLISGITRNRLERASMDLYIRLKGVRARLEDFEFPSLFAGIANSSTSSESKTVRFKAWKAAFMSTRRHVMSHYKGQYGSWPPKASSKKNAFEESGLNRLVLQDVYQDFADLYDLLVDRTSLTSRSADMPAEDDAAVDDPQEPTPRALRRVLSEFDRSTPPVQPPIPYDTPNIPSLSTTQRAVGNDAPKQAKERSKKLKDDQIDKMLRSSYNWDSEKVTPFLDAFRAFERKAARGRTIDELADLRNGQWIFLYTVLQSLPMVVVDAPGVRWTKGVEYFLCEPPKGNSPWSRDEGIKKSWYGIAGSTGVVSLPADVVDYGVEGIYRRSHCWEVAEKWSGHSTIMASAAVEDVDQLLPPPPGLAPIRSNSPSSRNPHRNSVQLGLEALPLPAGVGMGGPGELRPLSRHDPNRSFEDILGPATDTGKKKRR
ncbi:MAG: hypothetical protein M1827_003424 [Pycnora praestabilis]|nr:MAG: hypothetical protein M1827_003424 [Pycnora praestabilis]